MEIRKQYNIGQLAEQLQTEIEKSKKYNGVVKLDILTANNILDVLNETNRREQKHQTLESALTFIEKEDGTQTNLMEEHNKKPECFGRYKKNDNWEICEECPYEIQCHMEEGKKIAKVITTEGNPLEVSRYDDCFGEYKGEGNTKCLYCCLSDTCRDKTKNKEKKMVFFAENEDGTKEAKEVPRCYGNYKTRKSGFCNECQEATACEKVSILRRKVADE